MQFYRIIIIACLVTACAGGEPADSKAVRDERHALGMVLVEREEQKLLKLVVCAVQGEQLPEGAVLADESRCPDAFVDAEGNSYYFSELQPRGVRQRLLSRGYLKLGSWLLLPLALGTVVGWRARPLVKRFKLIVTSEGKAHLDRGVHNAEVVRQAKQAQDAALADVRTNTRVGMAAGLIMAIVTYQQFHDHLWGKGERLTVAHWDNIFRTHFSFAEAQRLENPAALRHILTALAAALDVKINPALNLNTEP